MKTKKQSPCAPRSICIEAETAEIPLSAFLSLFGREYSDGRVIDENESPRRSPAAALAADSKRKAS